MQNFFKKSSVSLILIGLLAGVAVPVWAGGCQAEITAVDKKIRKQYGEDITWWNFFTCPVCRDGDLRKDSIVTKAQIKEISSQRNFAYMLLRRGHDKQCVDELKTAKRMLRL